jgi:pimeloyl-ACP methyl ester carboxylesterase
MCRDAIYSLMRFSDIAGLATVLPAVGYAVLQRQAPFWARGMTGLAAVIVIYQLLSNNYRWHMVPVYSIIAIWLFLQLWPGLLQPGIYCGLAGVVCLFAAVVLGTLLPVFSFPAVTGSFPVGTVQLHLTDPGRSEKFSTELQARRELMAQIWYPAASAAGHGAFYVSRSATGLKTAHLALVRTRAAEWAPFSNRSPVRGFPVLLFVPSWVGGKAQNTFEAEELASHGFIIIGIDHPYGTKLTAFPDGRIVQSRLGNFLDASSDETLERCRLIAEDELRIRALDVHFVIDELTRLDAHDPSGLLTGRLDLSRIGIFGHSFGGAVAAQACFIDPRLQAGIDMDGILLGDVAEVGVRKPFLFMSDATPPPTAADLESPSPRHRRHARLIQRDISHIEHSLAAYGGYYMAVEGANHSNFSDWPLYCPVKRLTAAGPIRLERAMQIVNAYTLAFFRHYLTGTTEPLLERASADFKEVQFRKWPRPALINERQ